MRLPPEQPQRCKITDVNEDVCVCVCVMVCLRECVHVSEASRSLYCSTVPFICSSGSV